MNVFCWPYGSMSDGEKKGLKATGLLYVVCSCIFIAMLIYALLSHHVETNIMQDMVIRLFLMGFSICYFGYMIYAYLVLLEVIK